MRSIQLATGNPGKLSELRDALAPLDVEVVAPPSAIDVDEDQPTFAGNARKKALAYAAGTNQPTLADDSGLSVAALGGEPGVHSARFAGPQQDDAANIALLLERMQGVTDRRAQFTCALCLVEDGAVALDVSGTCNGTLLTEPRGDGGFGYDPIFVPDGHDRTFAQMTTAEKKAISHRGRAVAALVAALSVRP